MILKFNLNIVILIFIMCGINCIISLNNKKIENSNKKIEVMNKLTKHRGPDNTNCIIFDKIAFGHNRLSIIDVNKNSNQPLKIANYIIIFNGEIYNYKELKKRCVEWNFKTNSDTEVIIAMYDKYKDEFLNYLRGMYTFILHDLNNGNTVIVRDKLGIKPLYYYLQDDYIYFSSEAKALIPFLEKFDINYKNMYEYIYFQYYLGEDTLISGIKQLMPGHIIKIINCNIKNITYWNVSNIKSNVLNYDKDNKINDIISTEIKNCINLNLESDVPISSYVSGGIDSSIVSILSLGKVTTLFTGYFNNILFNETSYSRTIQKKYDKTLIEVEIKPEDFINNFKDICYYLDFPCGGPGIIPQYIMSKNVSKQYKTVLTGHGGDEIFGGYVKYFIIILCEYLKNNINCDNIINIDIFKNYETAINKMIDDDINNSLDINYFNINKRINEDIFNIHEHNEYIKEIFVSKFIEVTKNENNNSKITKLLKFDLKYFLPSLLQIEDRCSMAHGVESRVPLVDDKLIELVLSYPEEMRISYNKPKNILKEMFKNILPEEILNRNDKMGFPVPLNIWFNNDESVNSYVTELLISLKKRNLPFINNNNLDLIYNQTTYSRELWVLINIECWYQNFYDKFEYFKSLLF